MNAARTTVVLVRPQGPINIGMTCRLCANLGIAEVRIVSPACTVICDESRMFALHAEQTLLDARIFDDLPSALADCDFAVGATARHRTNFLPTLPAEAIAQTRVDRAAQHMALVFGSELNGLERDELQVCDMATSLPTPGPYPSYNLSHAVAIIGFLVQTVGVTLPQETPTPANHAQVDGLHRTFLETLKTTGYFRRAEEYRFGPKLRRMLSRWCISDYDVHIVRGMLAHISGSFQNLKLRLQEPSEMTNDSHIEDEKR